MTRFFLLVASVLFLAVAPAAAESGGHHEALTPNAVADMTLDQLFQELQVYAGSDSGRLIESEITRRFNKSGSATADLLMTWAQDAVEMEDYALALDVLDQVVILEPDYAEGWNKRATVYFLMEDYGSSLNDVRRTLALQPRHFGALAGLGFILEKIDEEEGAIRAFRRAVELNPQMEAVKEKLERLERETAGDEI